MAQLPSNALRFFIRATQDAHGGTRERLITDKQKVQSSMRNNRLIAVINTLCASGSRRKKLKPNETKSGHFHIYIQQKNRYGI